MSWFRRTSRRQAPSGTQPPRSPDAVEPLPQPAVPFWLPDLLEQQARRRAERATEPAASTWVAPGHEWTLTTPWVDPADSVSGDALVAFRTRLTASPPDGWVASSTVTVSCPVRTQTAPDGRPHLLHEPPLKATAVRIRRHSLEPAPEPPPLIDRLRMLHVRLLPAPMIAGADGRKSPWFPVGARQVSLASGHVGIEDMFAEIPGGTPTAWQVSVAADATEGLVGCIAGTAERRSGVTAASVMLGHLAIEDGDDPGFSWALPPGWPVQERLLLSTGTLDAQATIESLPDDYGHDEWVALCFDRAPFLRDAHQLVRRPVEVSGVGEGEMIRFDWQPSGRGRLLTSVALAARDGLGFMFTLEVSIEADGVLLTDPDQLLASIRVR